MSTLSEEKVLRINCPGFGTSSTLWLGEAKPLAMYDVIVVNAASVLHLFDEKSEVLKQVETLQNDGMTSYRAEDDSLLESITAELDLRSTQEMMQFLKKGGLLIYFLTPPFTMHGPTNTMDNYTWLGEWAPDNSTAANVRNMSATIRGKAIDVTPEGQESVWMPYLKQQNLEWSTIIRNENLTNGFVSLATAGPNKCIAGWKPTGTKNGAVVFLPAPYDSRYEAVLKECIEKWYASQTDEEPVPSGLANLSSSLSSLLTEDEAKVETTAVPVIPPVPSLSCEDLADLVDIALPPVTAEVPGADLSISEIALPSSTPSPVFEPIAEPVVEPVKAAKSDFEISEIALPASNPAPSESPPEFFDFDKNNHKDEPVAMEQPQSRPEPKELIRKMEQEISKPGVPDWCAKFSFNELDGLRQQLTDLQEEMRLAQLKATELTTRIEVMDDLKNSLLSAQGDNLTQATTRVFEALGWSAKPALGSNNEIWLIDDDKTQAIVHLVYTTSQPNRSELASLAESVITYWGAHEVEPKGILVASTFADKPPSERTEADYSETMNDFAKRKNLCLLTTAQLLSIFRDLTINETSPKEIREIILTTSGKIPGFTFESNSQRLPRIKAVK